MFVDVTGAEPPKLEGSRTLCLSSAAMSRSVTSRSGVTGGAGVGNASRSGVSSPYDIDELCLTRRLLDRRACLSSRACSFSGLIAGGNDGAGSGGAAGSKTFAASAAAADKFRSSDDIPAKVFNNSMLKGPTKMLA